MLDGAPAEVLSNGPSDIVVRAGAGEPSGPGTVTIKSTTGAIVEQAAGFEYRPAGEIAVSWAFFCELSVPFFSFFYFVFVLQWSCDRSFLVLQDEEKL